MRPSYIDKTTCCSLRSRCHLGNSCNELWLLQNSAQFLDGALWPSGRLRGWAASSPSWTSSLATIFKKEKQQLRSTASLDNEGHVMPSQKWAPFWSSCNCVCSEMVHTSETAPHTVASIVWRSRGMEWLALLLEHNLQSPLATLCNLRFPSCSEHN